MEPRRQVVLSLLLGLLASGVASAATSPAKTVQLFIEAHRQGRFAQAHRLLLEHVDVRASLFSNWLFGSGGAGLDAATADLFLSRKFTDAFQYKLLDTTPSGANQVVVTAVRQSPNLGHLYTWAIAPYRGTTPYVIITAIDDYLSKVNFPVEESHMAFTLIREVEDWYISAIRDEKFVQLQARVLIKQPARAAAPLSGVPAAPPVGAGVVAPLPPSATGDVGRQIADAQFNATLQSFNRPPPSSASHRAAVEGEQKPTVLSKIGNVLGLGKKAEPRAEVADAQLKQRFQAIRDAMAKYMAVHSSIPNTTDVYNWSSLRKLVNFYTKQPLPDTEELAGFRFVDYRPAGNDDYILLVELRHPQDGQTRLEVSAYGVDRAN